MVNVEDIDGMTPIEHAIMSDSHKRIVSYLRKTSARLLQKDRIERQKHVAASISRMHTRSLPVKVYKEGFDTSFRKLSSSLPQAQGFTEQKQNLDRAPKGNRARAA